jgi:Uma2 family endonuclease
MDTLDTQAENLIFAASEQGVRLELVQGLGIWEAHPIRRHQMAAQRIARSVRPGASAGSGCECCTTEDVLIRFPDGSLKAPDVAVFCQEPAELDEAVTLVPDAVVEVISKGYERKDTEIGPPFYLSQGVKDVLVFDPVSGAITHHRQGQKTQLQSPIDVVLECGCVVTI